VGITIDDSPNSPAVVKTADFIGDVGAVSLNLQRIRGLLAAFNRTRTEV
jgi:hypothetical protein